MSDETGTFMLSTMEEVANLARVASTIFGAMDEKCERLCRRIDQLNQRLSALEAELASSRKFPRGPSVTWRDQVGQQVPTPAGKAETTCQTKAMPAPPLFSSPSHHRTPVARFNETSRDNSSSHRRSSPLRATAETRTPRPVAVAFRVDEAPKTASLQHQPAVGVKSRREHHLRQGARVEVSNPGVNTRSTQHPGSMRPTPEAPKPVAATTSSRHPGVRQGPNHEIGSATNGAQGLQSESNYNSHVLAVHTGPGGRSGKGMNRERGRDYPGRRSGGSIQDKLRQFESGQPTGSASSGQHQIQTISTNHKLADSSMPTKDYDKSSRFSGTEGQVSVLPKKTAGREAKEANERPINHDEASTPPKSTPSGQATQSQSKAPPSRVPSSQNDRKSLLNSIQKGVALTPVENRPVKPEVKPNPPSTRASLIASIQEGVKLKSVDSGAKKVEERAKTPASGGKLSLFDAIKQRAAEVKQKQSQTQV